MTSVELPDVVNECTKMCRICLNTLAELYSIHDFGKLCNKTVKISDLLSECTSIEVTPPPIQIVGINVLSIGASSTSPTQN